ncbi:MAG: hypothetical protein KGH75_01590 [Rhodospirillales bacterium]|nr:hypothetical protein [Rhodospirillales bacterium]
MRLYEPVITKTTHFRDPDCFIVSLSRLNLALAAHYTNGEYAATAAERTLRKVVPSKMTGALKAIDSGDEIVAPWVHYLPEDDGVQLIDGRHRLYAMSIRGYTHVKIMCDRGMRSSIEQRLEREAKGNE